MSARFHIICFSPTGSTRKIAEAVAAGAGCRTVVKDVTLPTERSKAATLLQDDIVLLAAPVYYGRVERHAADFFGSLQGRGQSAVLLVNYGNRHFDDALLELHDLALNRGFAPIAAAAFVSEHSLSTADSPMAAGRPDTEDLGKARDFGAAVLAKLKSGASGLSIVPGNRPFKA